MRGGGLYIGCGTPIVQNCIILGNSVSSPTYRGEGGGVYCGVWAVVTISGCAIAGNSASGSGANPGEGGGIYLSNDYGSVRHCTVVGNIADVAGGISCNEFASVTITDSIVRSNTASQDSQISGPPSVSHCNIQGGWQGPGNIDADPVFVDPDSDDYHLSAGSPCIDAGDPQYVPYPNQRDCDSEPRVMGLRVDMGADEYTSAPTAVLNVYPKQLVFYADVNGPNPECQILHIENAGFAPLAWDVAEDCPWLAISGPPDGTQGACLDVDLVGLGPGRHDCEVTVTADHVPNSPQPVHASLYIRAGRYLHVPWPYDTIQSAIEAARDGDTVIIQPGIYTGDGNRDIDFLGKAITVQSTDPNDPTVVAGTIVDCGGTDAEPHRGLTFCSGEDANSVLMGLAITGGWMEKGAGIYIEDSSPSILCCNITENAGPSVLSTNHKGGVGVYIREGSPCIERCLIANNKCEGGSSYGGGIYCCNGSPVIRDCRIESNEVRHAGGGIHCEFGGTVILSGCTIVNNQVRFRTGGGVCLRYADGVVSHCLIAQNQSNEGGAGVFLVQSETLIRNCTIVDNADSRWGGGVDFSLGKLSLLDTILWGNRAPEGPQIIVYSWNGMYDAPWGFVRLTGVVDVLACDIQGGQSAMPVTGDPHCLELNWREDNIDADPFFASPYRSGPPNETPGHPIRSLGGPPAIAPWDYHLKSQTGRWGPQSESWVQDDVTSPCIDAGDPMSPIGLEPFPNGGRVNMGAYGGTAEASKSPASP